MPRRSSTVELTLPSFKRSMMPRSKTREYACECDTVGAEPGFPGGLIAFTLHIPRTCFSEKHMNETASMRKAKLAEGKPGLNHLTVSQTAREEPRRDKLCRMSISALRPLWAVMVPHDPSCPKSLAPALCPSGRALWIKSMNSY